LGTVLPFLNVGDFFLRTTVLTIVYAPVPGDGQIASRLIQGFDGAFYGTMSAGEPTNPFNGGVFRLDVPPVP
jgi:hypothetical protein